VGGGRKRAAGGGGGEVPSWGGSRCWRRGWGEGVPIGRQTGGSWAGEGEGWGGGRGGGCREEGPGLKKRTKGNDRAGGKKRWRGAEIKRWVRGGGREARWGRRGNERGVGTVGGGVLDGGLDGSREGKWGVRGERGGVG